MKRPFSTRMSSRSVFSRKASFALALLPLAVACGANPPLPPPPPSAAPVAWPAPATSAATPAPRETPDAEFRKQEPPPDGKVAFTPPKVEELKLKNGLRVLFVERHDLPIVSVEVVMNVGAGDLPGLRPGVVSMMGSMLEQGTKTRSALELSDAFEALGASHGAWAEWDSAGAEVKVLSSRLDQALDLLADIALTPAFPDAELERLRARRLGALKQEASSPSAMAGNALVASVYGRAHPYGNPLGGREEDVKKLSRADLVAAYGRLFAPAHATIVAAGDVTRDALTQKLEARFGAWKGANAEKGNAPKVAPFRSGTPRVVLVDKPGAQSQVWLSEPGVPRSLANKDKDALAVANAILGGMFSSRVNLNLREAHAYTYGAFSMFQMRHGAGPFRVGAAVVAEHTTDSVKEVLKEVDRIRDGAVTDDELADAKEHIKLAMPGRFEAVGEVSSALAELAIYGLPLDEFATLLGRYDAITKDDVLRVAKAYIRPAELRIVVVGDRAKLEPEMKALNVGVEIRDAYGDPVK